VSLVEADGGRLRLQRLQFWERRTMHRSAPGLKHAIFSENNGVRGLEILDEIGDQAVIANIAEM
jgi:hypothetical protein